MGPGTPQGQRMTAAPSRFVRDLLQTTAASVGTGLTLILLTRLAAQRLGPGGFGEYSVARRFIATATPVLTLSMGVAVARYSALVRDPAAQRRVLLRGLALALVPTLAACAVMLPAAGALGRAVFGRDVPWGLAAAMVLSLPGMSAFSVLFAWYRGTGRIARANLWQVAAIGAGPLAVVWLFGRGAEVPVFLALLALPLYATAIPLAALARPRSFAPAAATAAAAEREGGLGEIARYGVPRVPGGLALAAVLGAGVFLAPHVATLQDAGYLAMGQAVFALADAGLSGFGLIMLPRAAQMLADGRPDELRAGIADIVALSVHFGLFASLQLLVWAAPLVLVWLGAAYAPAVPLVRVQLAALAPYLFYTLLRSVVDALDARPVNTLNLGVALAVTLAVCAVGVACRAGALGLAAGTATGLFTLGAATIAWLGRGGWIAPGRVRLRLALGVNAAFGALSLGARLATRAWTPGASLAFAAVLVPALLLGYWLVLRRLHGTFTRGLEARLVRRGAA